MRRFLSCIEGRLGEENLGRIRISEHRLIVKLKLCLPYLSPPDHRFKPCRSLRIGAVVHRYRLSGCAFKSQQAQVPYLGILHRKRHVDMSGFAHAGLLRLRSQRESGQKTHMDSPAAVFFHQADVLPEKGRVLFVILHGPQKARSIVVSRLHQILEKQLVKLYSAVYVNPVCRILLPECFQLLVLKISDIRPEKF